MEKKTKKPKVIKEEVAVETPVASAPIKKEDKPFSTYILMFTIEGHKTWRVSFYQTKADLDVYLSRQLKHPKIVEKRWFICDRITGNITEEK